MDRGEIREWTLQVIERRERGERAEDSAAELKREWPQGFRRVARRLAGHANASLGDPILW